MSNCELCGQPMPKGEEMFKYHGYSGPCPKPELDMKFSERWLKETAKAEDGVIFSAAAPTEAPAQEPPSKAMVHISRVMADYKHARVGFQFDDKERCEDVTISHKGQDLSHPAETWITLHSEGVDISVWNHADKLESDEYYELRWEPVAAPQAESAGKPEPETDLDQLLAICEQNGTKWAHFKVSEIAKLRADLEQAKQENKNLREWNKVTAECAAQQNIEKQAAESSVTRLTREREEAKRATALLIDHSTRSDSLGVYGSDFTVCLFCDGGSYPGVAGFVHKETCILADGKLAAAVEDTWELVPELEAENKTLRKRAETAERERDELLQADIKRAQDITRLTLECNGFERERDQAREALRKVLASAMPNAKEHPTMFAAWKEAEAALVPANAEKAGRGAEQPEGKV